MAATPVQRVNSRQLPRPASPKPTETSPGDTTRQGAGAEPAAPGKAARKQRSLDEVFGDVLPDSTRDEHGDRSDQRADADYLRDVPPHHT